jgi:hypothetical protein
MDLWTPRRATASGRVAGARRRDPALHVRVRNVAAFDPPANVVPVRAGPALEPGHEDVRDVRGADVEVPVVRPLVEAITELGLHATPELVEEVAALAGE